MEAATAAAAAAASSSTFQPKNILASSTTHQTFKPKNFPALFLKLLTSQHSFRCFSSSSSHRNSNTNSDKDRNCKRNHKQIVEPFLPDTSQNSPSSTPPTSQQQTPINQDPNSTPPPPHSTSQGLVLDLGPANVAWDAHAVGSPVVKRFLSDDEERWYMWYHGCASASSADSLGLAVSANGVHWERPSAPVLQRSDDWWAFDIGGLRPSDVLVMASARVRVSTAVYWLYYTGFSFTREKIDIDNFEEPLSSRSFPNQNVMALPGLAMSQDGRHWARIEGEHHSGALMDVGGQGEWDSTFIAGASVVYHGSGDLRMYYHSFDVNCGCFCMGMARSRDGIKWVKLGKVLGRGEHGDFDEAGVMNGHVVGKRGGGYVMAYEGIDGRGRRSIGLSESPDGLKNWRRLGDGPVLEPPMGMDGWDSVGVGCPCLVKMDGGDEWRVYYRGVGKGGRTGIGMAVSASHGVDFPTSFERWTGFHHN